MSALGSLLVGERLDALVPRCVGERFDEQRRLVDDLQRCLQLSVKCVPVSRTLACPAPGMARAAAEVDQLPAALRDCIAKLAQYEADVEATIDRASAILRSLPASRSVAP